MSTDQSLTEYEVIGLKTHYNFADGHAYHALHKALQPIIADLPNIWQEAASTPVAVMEESFKQAFGTIIGSPALSAHNHYSLCPTASSAIDITAAWLKSRDHKVGLIEPVFDNLYLLLKRRQAPLTPVSEGEFSDPEKLKRKVALHGLTALFLVSPNNPTGFHLSEAQFRNLCQLCADMNLTLILDATFGLYARAGYDEYVIMQQAGIDYVVIEDTGKTWPTQEIKASLLSSSPAIAKEVRLIYEEVYLCHSNFSLALLTRLIQSTHAQGIANIIWREVDKRRQGLADAIENTALRMLDAEKAVPMPLAWIDCSALGIDDLAMVEKLKASQIAVLPGRFFYWASPGKVSHHIRLSLMRPDAMFSEGLAALRKAVL